MILLFRHVNLLILGLLTCFCIFTVHSSHDELIDAPKNYQQLSADNKRDWLWNKGILNTRYNKLPPFEDIKIAKLILSVLKKKMDVMSDFAPKRWKKSIHRRSVVAKFRFIPSSDHSYTGLLSDIAIGLIRASLTYKPNKRGVAPGLALKFLVDGNPSVDISLLTGLDSHGQDYNFFAKPFTNIIPLSDRLGVKIVQRIFKRVTNKTNYLAVDHLSEISSNGSFVDKHRVSSPVQLFLVPTQKFSSSPARDIREDLMSLHTGEKLFSVYATKTIDYMDGDITAAGNLRNLNNSELIGKIVLDSEFVASEFGDDQLFFRHQRFDKNKGNI